MKRGKVKALAISHKNGKSVLRSGAEVSEADVNSFDELVKSGHIEEEKKTPSKKIVKKEDK